MEKTGKDSGVNLTKVRSKRCDRWSKDERRKSSFCLTDGHLSFEECRIGGKTPKIQMSSCTPRWYCKRRLWSLRSFYWARLICVPNDCRKSNGSYCKISRLRRHAADAVSACTQAKLEDAPRWLKIPKTECPDVWIRLPRQKWPKSWRSIEDLVELLERHLYGHPLARLLWERQCEDALLELGWDKIPNWESMFVQRKQGLFLSVCVDDIKMAGKEAASGPYVEETDERRWSWRTHMILDHLYLGCTQRECKPNETVIEQYTKMFGSRISAVATENTGKASRKKRSVVLRHGRTCWKKRWGDCELANKKVEQHYKVSSPCLDDHKFKQKELESVGALSDVCSQIVLRFL